MIGRTLRHHRIVEKIGAGGMGEVYLARDERLEREVAIKVLHADAVADEAARRRFRNEALALSRLNHPNIETVHEFDTEDGVDFLVMEFVPGTTLSDRIAAGPLPEKDVVRLGTQLAEALAAAHDQGVIHRDLKPGNLRLTPDGRLKVLDFGLALLRRPVSLDSVMTHSAADLPEIAGTLPYMSPEQLRGEPVDPRSDIWSAGVVLYEMASGRRPFDNEAPTALLAEILEKPIVPGADLARVSPGLQHIILKCLEKDPDLRYQSARDLLADFRRLGAAASTAALPPPSVRTPVAPPRRTRLWLPLAGVVVLIVAGAGAAWMIAAWRDRTASGPSSRITSLAVLPLANLSGDAAQDPVVEGMHEALITELSRISALRVISRTSAVRYKGTTQPLAEIAKELNVSAVVAGTVLRSGSRLRVTAQLIEVEPERHLWADSFDRELTDVLYLTSDVAQTIARQIRIALTPDEKAHLARARSVDSKAYELYALGRHYWSQRGITDYKRAIESFRKALELDPGYAPAYAAIADCYIILGEQGGVPPKEARAQSAEAIRKALELDPDLAEAHASLGQWKYYYEWNWAAAEEAFKRSIALNPGYALAHQLYGRFLGFMGRFDDGLRELQRARELDPLSIIVHAYTAQIHLFARQHDRAVEHLLRAMELNPNHPLARHNLGEVYLAQGRFGDAIVELEKAVELTQSRSAHYLAMLGSAYARANRHADARRILQDLTARSTQDLVSSFDMASLLAALGETGQALDWLERAYEARDSWLAELKAWPWLEGLAGEPRFQAIMGKLNFPG